MLRLAGEPFEWVETDIMRRESRTPEFLARNPNGRVPLLELPDGRLLAESNAMLLFLGEGTPYVPADAWQRALAWQWLFFEQYSHEPYIAVARFIGISGRAEEEADRLVTLRERGYQALAVMEQTLERSPWFAGDRFSVADIALYAYTHVADEGGFDLAGFPRLTTWLDRVQEQPGFLSMAEACR